MTIFLLLYTLQSFNHLYFHSTGNLHLQLMWKTLNSPLECSVSMNWE